MQAILFPVTYISETFCEAISACFHPVRVYQPTRRQIPRQLQALSQKGLVDIVIPAAPDDKKIEALVRDYRQWAELHQGGVLAYLKRQGGSPPFFDDTATARIKADIQHPARGPEACDSLFNARVFLQIAQEYDLQADEIARKLFSTNQAEQNLFKSIIGETDDTAAALRPQVKERADSSPYLIEPRMLAWSRLFFQDTVFDPAAAPTVFVTIHREALEFLMEGAPAAAHLLKVPSLPIISRLSEGYDDWQLRFVRLLESLPENADAQAADLIARYQETDHPVHPKAQLTLYRIAGSGPAAFFGRCIGRRHAQENRENVPGDRNGTLLGLVEMDYRL
ncbi:MAG: hypothetical protein AB1427_02480 [Thermodesulfobacteriota bacterium]